MIRLLDGPATDTLLSLERAPLFLRIAFDDAGEIRALDKLKDEARTDERLYAYVRVLEFRQWDYASYRYVAAQPADEVMRSNMKWRNWCVLMKDEMEQPKETAS